MRAKRFWIALCLAVGLASLCACRTALGVRPAQACADWRWIGISQPGASCPPAPAGWKQESLFPDLKRPDFSLPDVPGPAVLDSLGRFCVYEIEDPNRSASELPAPKFGPELERLDRDCAALSIAATRDPSVDIARLRNEIFPAGVGLGTPLQVLNGEGVRLAFLDTQPTSDEPPKKMDGAPLHGYTLSRVAQRMVCPDGPCAARITTRLALPIRQFDRRKRGDQIQTHQGGYIGMQGDLAKAIVDEVNAWQRHLSQRHLVLNLSLAWDGRLFGGLKENEVRDMRAGTQAVYRALQYAAGYDALVLAAAGNQKRKPCRNDGPLLPAAWESERTTEGKPLVYAVGGVTSEGRPLVNARPGGMPRRAALGVVPAEIRGLGPAPILVGSSVSTAVVSSIAAVVWDSFPDLKSQQVMDILDRSGRELAYETNFWFGSGERPTPRWLSLCAALATACDGRGPCPVEPSSCPPLEKTPDLAKKLLSNPEAKGSCKPWVMPQPEDDPCPVCPPKKN